MSEPIEVVRREFSESYVSLRAGKLYAWWQVSDPQWVRMEVVRGATIVVDRAELVALVKMMVGEAEEVRVEDAPRTDIALRDDGLPW